ncbi:MAG TPA: putative glycoside hydrolase [Spirochaetota bacterium]|nr:putative glycoside hydrolase [Spirochaetota bacterium]HPJ35419.1 putative glycoside hydrolase [Spirochaetota bacterium]
MKKVIITLSVIIALFAAGGIAINYISAKDVKNSPTVSTVVNKIDSVKNEEYTFPEFYRGIYLTVDSANKMTKLKIFVSKAKEAGLNTLVMDVQSSKYAKCIVPSENVQYVKDNGLHAIARVVIFPDGLKNWPVSETYIKEKIDIAESACKNGFKEIQFDYIRFNDSNRNRHLKVKERYAFIEGFISRAKKKLKPYNVKFAADVFGRIPLNTDDVIGQKMESMDKVVDFICPMAYPSHYTWSKRLMKDPYFTVFKTSKRAKERVKSAEIVTWIQAFKMKLYGMPFDKYIREQIKAVHDSGIRGYLLWNARQDYKIPFRVVKNFYDKNSNLASK